MALSSSPVLTVRLAVRAYQCLLALYPAGFRAEYGYEMKLFFEERSAEAFEAAGTAGIGRWMLKVLVGELTSIYNEHVDTMTETFRSRRDAWGAVGLGAVFLAGTWMALFFLGGGFIPTLAGRASGSGAGFVPGAVLALANGLRCSSSNWTELAFTRDHPGQKRLTAPFPLKGGRREGR